MKRYLFIAAHAATWPVQGQCRVLGVSKRGYYGWCQRPSPPAATAPGSWQAAAKTVFEDHARRYGTRRLRAQLPRAGHRQVGRQRLRTWLRVPHLRAHYIRSPDHPRARRQPTRWPWRPLIGWPTGRRSPPGTRSGWATPRICP